MTTPRLSRRSVWRRVAGTLVLLGVLGAYVTTTAPAKAAVSRSRSASVTYAPRAGTELDCNGRSKIPHSSKFQHPVRAMLCTDIRGLIGVNNSNTWGGKFYDNGLYIGHDEPDTTFLSSRPGSGNNVTWTETLGKDPAVAPRDSKPGQDTSHWFELSSAPWFSMAMCDPGSYPQLPCTPRSDKNAPACPNPATCPNSYPGGGSAFMEMQLYPPGNPPFVDSESCDNTHWCAALTIDSLECTQQFAQCNTQCEEPINFAFIQTNGVPAGPPSPQKANISSSVPNAQTLLMNPGDKITVRTFDASVPGGGSAFEVKIDDLTLHKTGFMQASARNGFERTSLIDCSGTPFNFQPEYSTAKPANVIPWAALATNISTEFETGHFEPCTSLSGPITNPFDPSDTGGTYSTCSGPYETAGGAEGPETADTLCYNVGDTHANYDGAGSSTPPDMATGCQDNVSQNGDLDFDGSAYWTEWPTRARTGTYPSSFVESPPTTTRGSQYSQWFFQTDLALSESSCTPGTPKGCTVPPNGPGKFYPYWSQVRSGGTCVFEFGNVHSVKGVNTFGRDAQYGTNQMSRLGYPEFEGKTYTNTCPPTVVR